MWLNHLQKRELCFPHSLFFNFLLGNLDEINSGTISKEELVIEGQYNQSIHTYILYYFNLNGLHVIFINEKVKLKFA